MTEWLSDAFCRLVYGAGFSTRQLFTDSREKLFYVIRPVLLNGISDIAYRSDFLERSLIIALAVIPPERRRRESEFWADFNEARPRIFGALLNALSGALREMPLVQTPNLPRMADFAHFGIACERALGWPDGSFMEAYEEMRAQSDDQVLENCPYAIVVEELAAKTWKGTATELLEKLNQSISDDFIKRRKTWPAGPSALSNSLRRLAPNFRNHGIEIDCDGKTPGSNSKRFISIRRIKSIDVEQNPTVALKAKIDALAKPHVRSEDQDLKNRRIEEMRRYVAPKIRGSGPDCYGEATKHDEKSVKCLDCPYEHNCKGYIGLVKSNHVKEWTDEFEHLYRKSIE